MSVRYLRILYFSRNAPSRTAEADCPLAVNWIRAATSGKVQGSRRGARDKKAEPHEAPPQLKLPHTVGVPDVTIEIELITTMFAFSAETVIGGVVAAKARSSVDCGMVILVIVSVSGRSEVVYVQV